MAVAAKIKFTQGASNPPPGEALIGVAAVPVVCSNEDNSGVEIFTWEVIDKPPTSAVPSGIISSGPAATFQFTPDAAGGYLIHLKTADLAGNVADDFRAFQVPEPSGYIIPPFGAGADALNFGGQSRGWAKYVEEMLRHLLTAGGGGTPGGSPGQVQFNNAGAFGGLAGGLTVVDTFVNRPATPAAGTRFIPTDGPGEWVYDGSTWRPYIDHAMGKSLPALGGFTGQNLGASSWTETQGRIVANGTSAGVEMRAYVRAAADPATLSVTAHVRPVSPKMVGSNIPSGAYPTSGIVAWDSVSDRSFSLTVGDWNSQLNSFQFTQWSTFTNRVSFEGGSGGTPFRWLRLRASGGTLFAEGSPNGHDWLALTSTAIGGVFVPTHVGPCLFPIFDAAYATFSSYEDTAP